MLCCFFRESMLLTAQMTNDGQKQAVGLGHIASIYYYYIASISISTSLRHIPVPFY